MKNTSSCRKVSGIYAIVNTVNDKRYIGQSADIEKRFIQHGRDLCNKKSVNTHLQHAWDFYGKELFEFEILEECAKDELNNLEIWYMERFNLFGLYNIAKGGNIPPYQKGVKKSEEHKQKIAKSHVGMKYSQETKEKISKIKLEHPVEFTEELRQKFSENSTGRKRRGCSSNYRGVYLNRVSGRWVAQLCTKKYGVLTLGTFVEEIDAARYRDNKILELGEDIRKLNFK
jgi:group I intron endonuclease